MRTALRTPLIALLCAGLFSLSGGAGRWSGCNASHATEAGAVCGVHFKGVRAPGAPFRAILPDGAQLPPQNLGGGLHGNMITPDQVIREGGLKGYPDPSWDLAEHVKDLNTDGAHRTAFRGTTPQLSTVDERGAADWAGENGYVYDIGPVPTWDVNLALQGRLKRPDGTFADNPFSGEMEFAIPREVPLSCIKGWFKVFANAEGRILGMKTRQSFTANPAYDAAVCKKYFAID